MLIIEVLKGEKLEEIKLMFNTGEIQGFHICILIVHFIDRERALLVQGHIANERPLSL